MNNEITPSPQTSATIISLLAGALAADEALMRRLSGESSDVMVAGMLAERAAVVANLLENVVTEAEEIAEVETFLTSPPRAETPAMVADDLCSARQMIQRKFDAVLGPDEVGISVLGYDALQGASV